jgi:hypothetical protein
VSLAVTQGFFIAGAPDFFYKEAQRLGYVAHSAFKVLFHSFTPSFPTSFYQSKPKVCLFLRACETAAVSGHLLQPLFHRTQPQNSFFMHQTPFLMSQNSIPMPQKSFLNSKLKPRF